LYENSNRHTAIYNPLFTKRKNENAVNESAFMPLRDFSRQFSYSMTVK
jgi:hypothetical protein